MAKCASPLREIRTRLGLSQAECATALGVALETFRAWDAGRRTAPEAIVNQARTLKAKRLPHDRVPLQVLADELHVHVRTLRAAAHDGRLAAKFGPRPFYGKLTATATREAAAIQGDMVSPDLWTRSTSPGARVPRDSACELPGAVD